MNTQLIYLYLQLNAILISILCISLCVRRYIQTRKIIHITFGPIYLFYTDLLVKQIENPSFYEKLLISSEVLLFTFLFILSYFVKGLQSVLQLLIGNDVMAKASQSKEESTQSSDNSFPPASDSASFANSHQGSKSEKGSRVDGLFLKTNSFTYSFNNGIDGVLIYGIFFSVYIFICSDQLKAALLCLSFGDGLAPYGNFFHKPGKTLGGSLFCFAGCCMGLFIFEYRWYWIVFYSLICTIIEHFCTWFDNLAIVLGLWSIGQGVKWIQKLLQLV